MSHFQPCILIPTYDNPDTIGKVVDAVREHLDAVIVVDDGSGEEARRAVAEVGESGRAIVHRLEVNQGKGAAVKAGFRIAAERGYTHALQVDADGQHDLDAIPRFLALAHKNPESLVLGYPIFDETVPAAREYGRKITRFWTHIETYGRVITDPMCGFRVYPVQESLAVGRVGDRMDFDIDIAVRMVWNRVPVLNEALRVRYLAAEEGGVSHFRMFRDNARISWLHTKLTTTAIVRAIFFPFFRSRRAPGLTASVPTALTASDDSQTASSSPSTASQESP